MGQGASLTSACRTTIESGVMLKKRLKKFWRNEIAESYDLCFCSNNFSFFI